MNSGFLQPEKLVANLEIPSDSNVIDLGCGAGHLIEELTHIVTKGNIVGVDTSFEKLSTARTRIKHQKSERVQFVEADITKSLRSYFDEKFDYVFLKNVLHQIDSSLRGNVLQNIKDILSDHGIVVVIEWHKTRTILGPHQDDRIAEQEVRMLFSDSKYIESGEIASGKFHYGILFKKS